MLELLPPDRRLTVLDIGCGEGRNAVFFARNGYHVSAFDLSPIGVAKTAALASAAGAHVNAFVADINTYRLERAYDILFSTGVLQYVPPFDRQALFADYRAHTRVNGLNAFSVFVEKPFVAPAPDAEPDAHPWISGEILTYYRDWRIEHVEEAIFTCHSSGIAHQHAVNRIIARKVVGG
jgi:tellurite methyltransferase